MIELLSVSAAERQMVVYRQIERQCLGASSGGAMSYGLKQMRRMAGCGGAGLAVEPINGVLTFSTREG